MTAPAAPCDLVVVAVALGAWGVRGQVRLRPLGTALALEHCPDWWLRRGAEPWRPLRCLALTRHGETWLARLSGCADREAAALIRGDLAVSRAGFPELPAGEYWLTDLIGCRAVNREGQDLGQVTAVRVGAGQDLLELRRPGPGRTPRLIPLIDAYVLAVDLPARSLTVDWRDDWD